MKRALLLLSLALVACRVASRDQSVENLNRDVIRLTKENAIMRVRLDQSEAVQMAMMSDLKDARTKIAELQMRGITAAPSSVTRPANTPASPEEWKRGGFTEMARTRPSAAPVEYASAPRSDRPAIQQTSASWNDVAKASDFYDSFDVMTKHCRAEWPNNAEMLNYCMRKQSEALAALTKGRPFGSDEKRWSEARVKCAAKWPDDYSMRVYCESKGGD